MKKLLSIVLAASLVASASVTAFASFAQPNGTNDMVLPVTPETVFETPVNRTIPVYGYVGPDGEIYDPDPDDPDEPPIIRLGVSVPVKLMWAAFASDGGDITSPNYFIRNFTSTPVNVSIRTFEVNPLGDGYEAAHHTAVDSDLVLIMEGLGAGTGTASHVTVWDEGQVINPSATRDIGTLAPFSTNLNDGHRRTFTIGGFFDGSLDVPLTGLRYNMILRFEADIPPTP